MTDAFDRLTLPPTTAVPDPHFVSRLRARLERALDLPEGVTMSADVISPTVSTTPAGAAIPYLAVRDAPRALDWYVDVFGAELLGEPIVMPDGRIGHAELSLPSGLLYLSEEHPEIGVAAPQPGATAVSLVLPVRDTDATRAAVLAAGGRSDREPYDGYGERNAWVIDPFGHRWLLHSALPAAAPPTAFRDGDIAYVSLLTPEPERAAAFYSAVLGWQLDPGGRRVIGSTPSHGLHDGSGTLFCCYAVADLPGAVQRVRQAGGEAGEPVTADHGRTSDCVDNQGIAFALFEAPVVAGDRPPANGRRPGDVSYVTMQVRNSAAARQFYGAVLGWEFSPGRVDDGWQLEDVRPMTGVSGGHADNVTVPMWKVADVVAAVAAVRAHGGTATDPERQPYGVTAHCTDDQGTRFYLGDA